jgi:hypothetical protein
MGRFRARHAGRGGVVHVSPRPTPPGDGPVEQYLDELYRRLRVPPRRARQILAETEAHLYDSTAAGLAAGLSEQEAEGDAVARFGSAAAFAATCRPRPTRRSTVMVLPALASVGWLLAAAGLIAIGVSGRSRPR